MPESTGTAPLAGLACGVVPAPSVLPAQDAGTRATARVAQQVPAALDDAGRRFAAHGHALHLVGGPVRDALLGRGAHDWDVTTDARPPRVRELLSGWADAVWDVGEAFGTLGFRRGDLVAEVTTYRAESYEPGSRKPAVEFGDDLCADLSRRDLTVNAMALSLPDHELVDPYGGLVDLAERTLRTPGPPEQSLDDDPLRILRVARFMSQLGFAVDGPLVEAMASRAPRLAVVSAERVREELDRLLLGEHPRAALELLVDTGVADHVLPELPAMRLEVDEHHQHKDVYDHSLTVLDQAVAAEDRLPGGGPDLVLRWAALLHDVGKPATKRHEPGGRVSFHHHEVKGARLARRRLSALRQPRRLVDAVALLVEMHLRFHGYGTTAAWTDSAVRRYVRDAGDQLDRLHVLVRSDCTTRNRRKAQRLEHAYEQLEDRIAELSRSEELASLRPDLDGREIMEILGLPPGPLVGRARAHLLELRTEHGPLPREEAVAALRAWAAEQGVAG